MTEIKKIKVINSNLDNKIKKNRLINKLNIDTKNIKDKNISVYNIKNKINLNLGEIHTNNNSKVKAKLKSKVKLKNKSKIKSRINNNKKKEKRTVKFGKKILKRKNKTKKFSLSKKLLLSSQNKFLPLEEKSLPLQEKFLPLEEKSLPLQEKFLPLEEKSLPLQEKFLPLEEKSLPLQEKFLPLEEKSLPLQEKFLPLEEKSLPLQEKLPYKDSFNDISIEKQNKKYTDKKKSNTDIKFINVDIDKLLDKLSEKAKQISSSDNYIEAFSFLDDIPKVSKITYKNYDVQNLYSNIDKLSKKETKNKKNIIKKALIEELKIPKVIPLKDNIKNIKDVVNSSFYVKNKTKSKIDIFIPNFIDTPSGVNTNPKIKEKIKKVDKSKKIKINLDLLKKQNLEGSNKLEEDNSSIEFILPKDVDSYKKSGIVHKNLIINNQRNTKLTNLIYSVKIDSAIFNRNINERYSIDEFSYVLIHSKKDGSIYYEIIQPELKKDQLETFNKIKKIFFNSINKNYFSFSDDKYLIEKYIEKLFDLSVSKLEFKLNSLEKKLYFTFIKRDFSGLGFLSNILKDKNILEVSCSGEKTSISVNHIKYGKIKTNLSFKNISEVNLFVLRLTKIMGLYVNSNHPIFKGNLSNGYKVEGLYSVGNISNKGSSFVIKKYLDEPLTPVSLIKNGVGVLDVFSYIWNAINNNYNIVLCSRHDNLILENSLLLFYPNKEIISVQSQDVFKLPQENWIKRIVKSKQLDKKSLILESISEKPDYLVVDNFTEDLFDLPWFNINMLSIDENLIGLLINKIKLNKLNYIIIYLDKITYNMREYMQITKIVEFTKGEDKKIINYIADSGMYHINLLSSSLDIVRFNKNKKILRWLFDSKITDYRDFNTIINEYNENEDKLLKKLKIE